MESKEKKDSGSLAAYLKRGTVDYTKQEKPAPEKKKSPVKALATKSKPERPKPTRTVKTMATKQPEKPAKAPKDKAPVVVDTGNREPASHLANDQSVFAQVSRDLTDRLPGSGKSVHDMLKQARAVKKAEKGRDR